MYAVIHGPDDCSQIECPRPAPTRVQLARCNLAHCHAQSALTYLHQMGVCDAEATEIARCVAASFLSVN